MNKQCLSCTEEKPLDLFHNNKSKKDGKSPYCKDCSATYQKEYRKNNPEKSSFYKRNTDSAKNREYQYLYKHGISREEFLKVLEEQGGCKICGIDILALNEKWYVDHDHNCCKQNTSCNKCQRGILCRSCNLMLGYAKDNVDTLQKAVSYLREKVKDGNV